MQVSACSFDLYNKIPRLISPQKSCELVIQSDVSLASIKSQEASASSIMRNAAQPLWDCATYFASFVLLYFLQRITDHANSSIHCSSGKCSTSL